MTLLSITKQLVESRESDLRTNKVTMNQSETSQGQRRTSGIKSWWDSFTQALQAVHRRVQQEISRFYTSTIRTQTRGVCITRQANQQDTNTKANIKTVCS
jgi:hypothetical protein